MKIDENVRSIIQFDDRFYQLEVDGEVRMIPSVTTKQGIEASEGLDKWKQEMGLNAPAVLKQAADRGSRIHDAIEKALEGKGVICNPTKNPRYTRDELVGFSDAHIMNDDKEYQAVIRALNFMNSLDIETFDVETTIYDLGNNYAGRQDVRALINSGTIRIGQKKVPLQGNYVIDWKSGGAYPKHAEQVVAYAKAWELMHKIQVDGALIVYLNAKTDSKISFKLIKRVDFEEHFQKFLMVSKLYDMRNGIKSAPRDLLPAMVSYKAFQNQLDMGFS